MRRGRGLLAWWLVTCAPIAGCGGSSAGPIEAGSTDATDATRRDVEDASHHDASDASRQHKDARADTGADAGSDSAADAGADAEAGSDAGADAEAGADAAPDAVADVVMTDAIADVVTTDAIADAPLEAGEAAPPSLCNPTFLFCDGFEMGLATWTQIYASGGAPSVDSTHVYRGSYALHAHVDPVVEAGATAYAYLQQVQTWPSHVFTRIFAYQPSPHAPSPSAILDMVGGAAPYAGIELLTDPPAGGLGMKTYNTGVDQAWQSDGGAIAFDKWVCFELEVDVTAGTSHLYMNDTEVTDLAQTSLALSSLGILGVGLSYYLPSVQGAQDTWIDEVAVNGTRIGCAK